jgi:predicted nucleic-acid-binding protein
MIGFDTNILIRFFTGDDNGKLQKVRALLQAHRGETYYVNHMTLCEMVWVLRSTYRYSKEHIGEALAFITQSEALVVEHAETVLQALEIFDENNVDFADLLIGLHNKIAGCSTTLTFDKQAAKLDEFMLLA